MRLRALVHALPIAAVLGGCSSSSDAPAHPEDEEVTMSKEEALAFLRTGARLPTGLRITADAAPGSRFEALDPHLPTRPGFVADHASATALSPDGSTLLVLTSGYNRNVGPNAAAEGNEYVF